MIDSAVEAAAKKFSVSKRQVQNTLQLFEEGATIPFVARYRKEVTGSLDEVQLADLQQMEEKAQAFAKRKTYILATLKEQEVLTEKLQKQIEQITDADELEDVYLPFKSKRKTKADKAKEAGLEGLANIIMAGRENDLTGRAKRFLCKTYPDVKEALSGARDIIAERINEHPVIRERVREQFDKHAQIHVAAGKNKEEDEGVLFTKFVNSVHRLKTIPAHRFLALKRGEEKGILRLKIAPDEQRTLDFIIRFFTKNHQSSGCTEQVEIAVSDAYKRLLQPSLENEFAAKTKQRADEEAVASFTVNLEQLLLSPPAGNKRVLALDPGFRTGCKVVCLDEHGDLLHNETIYPHPPQNKTAQAKSKLNTLVNMFKIEAVAIGNGTAGRETEQLMKHIRFERDLEVFVVDESGASVYSASKTAREEFPDYDVTVRGAVSIGRRLQDPLAELVKIDPKSIGVGQYQHDVNQTLLRKALEQTVINTVNKVGVDLNTASAYLLQYVAGLGTSTAKNIVSFRTENGAFTSRSRLKKVPKIGEKAFAQAAGFLRIRDGINVLDNTAVHPERYDLVKRMAQDAGFKLNELAGRADAVKRLPLEKYVTTEVGLPTLRDIAEELMKPGRDFRQKAKSFSFSNRIKSIADVEPGMVLPGMVSNITDFGAFIDLGIKENGLVHKSEMARDFVRNPADVVRLHQEVEVKVLTVDADRKRIGLTMVLG